MNNKELLLKAIRGAIHAGNAILDIYNDENFEIEIKSDKTPLTKADKLSQLVIENQLIDTRIPILSEEGKKLDYQTRSNWSKYWLVDPLDGTKEFIKRNGEFTVNIALMEKNFPVLGVIYVPVTNDLYFAAENMGSYKINMENNKAIQTLSELQTEATVLPEYQQNDYVVVASRSHLSQETQDYIDTLKKQKTDLTTTSKGSSLKLCLIAEGKADVYPRFAPTMEWDIAAGHAIVLHSGGKVLKYPEMKAIEYNKEELLNPWFIAISKDNKFSI